MATSDKDLPKSFFLTQNPIWVYFILFCKGILLKLKCFPWWYQEY